MYSPQQLLGQNSNWLKRLWRVRLPWGNHWFRGCAKQEVAQSGVLPLLCWWPLCRRRVDGFPFQSPRLVFFFFIYYQQIFCHQWVSLSLPAHTMFTPLRQTSQWLLSHPPVRVTSQTGSGTQAQSKTISSRICFKVGNFHIKMWVYGIADGFPPERGKRCVKTFSWQIRRTWQAGASSPQGRRLCFPLCKDADAGPGCFVPWSAATALAQAQVALPGSSIGTLK